jgi:hypothetical protein
MSISDSTGTDGAPCPVTPLINSAVPSISGVQLEILLAFLVI